MLGKTEDRTFAGDFKFKIEPPVMQKPSHPKQSCHQVPLPQRASLKVLTIY